MYYSWNDVQAENLKKNKHVTFTNNKITIKMNISFTVIFRRLMMQVVLISNNIHQVLHIYIWFACLCNWYWESVLQHTIHVIYNNINDHHPQSLVGVVVGVIRSWVSDHVSQYSENENVSSSSQPGRIHSH